jgi:hypothetical protein
LEEDATFFRLEVGTLTPTNPAVFNDQKTRTINPKRIQDWLTARLQSVPPWCRQALIFLLSFAILVSRRPDAILRPQFFIEDGPIFYAQAYNAGLLQPMFWTYSGYLHTFPRLIADLSQFFPLVYAPLIFNLAALILQILPVQILLSSRLKGVGSLPTRAFLALLYLSLPNSSEVHVNLAGAHWRLAIIAFLVIVAAPPRGWKEKFFDYCAVLMCALTGPLAIMLTPISFLAWVGNRDRWKLILTSTVVTCAAVQGSLILMAGRAQRLKEPLGANLASLLEIVSNHVFTAVLIGRNVLFNGHPLGALGVSVLGSATLLYGLYRGPQPLKLFILFACLVLTCSLASPMVPWPVVGGIPAGPRIPGWQLLALGGEQRYWFMPMLAFLATLVWLLKPASPAALHLLAILCFVLMPVAVVRDWRCWPRVDLHFAVYAEEFRQAPRGAALVIPLNPPGWSMRLIKH